MNPGSPRPAPPAAAARPAYPNGVPADEDGATGSGHPAVDAALRGIANTAALPPADQIAQYEAAHRTLRATLATIDQS